MEPSPPGAITFLFTDLEGSTRLWEQHPEAMQDALRRHDAILRAAIEGSAGRVVKTTGDGMMAVFEGPAGAVNASLAAQRGLEREPWPGTGPLRARMGVHAGPAEERAGDFFGPTVNRTARIMAVGNGGQVLLSGSAADLLLASLPAGFGVLDLGEHRLKDLGRAERIFQLLHADLAREFPPLATAGSMSAQLPTRAAALIGRQAELGQILGLLADPAVRLVTLTGPGGTGKTTLALRVAEELAPSFSGNVCFVDLSSARDTPAVLLAIARAVGLGDVMDRPLEMELTAWLRQGRRLLVLDNFEQAAEAAGAVANLIRDCPGLTVLATSRQALHIRAERVYQVLPLTLPLADARRVTAEQAGASEAVQLFVDRARTVRPDFGLTDQNASAIVEICRRLDGLPLAIELAASRLRLFSPEVLRDRLDDRLGLLRSGPRDLPERQQTLRAAMDWSYELLDQGEQRLFEFLAVFADVEIAALEAVAEEVLMVRDAAPDLLDGLASLIEKSLVRQIDVPGGEPRVTMLETIREFAGDKLDRNPDFSAAARRAHAEHFADLAHRLRGNLLGEQREAALDGMTAELANLRIAWRYWVAAGDLEQLDKLADSLLILNDARTWYLDTVGLTTDMLAVLKSSAATPGRISQEIALRTTLARALMTTKGFTQDVEDALVGALELFERGGDIRQQFSVLRGLASLYQFTGQFEPAAQLGQQILELGEQEHDQRMLIDGHLLVGVATAFGTGLEPGLQHLDTAISLFEAGPRHGATARVANDPRIACFTTSGFTLWLMGYPDRAVERMMAALTLAEELRHPITSAYAAFHAGLLHIWRREPELALARATRVLEVADEHELGIWTAVGSCLLGAAEVGLGRTADGLANIRAGLEQYTGRRSPPVFWPMLKFLSAGASHVAGRPAEGLTSLEPAIEIMSQGPGTSLLPEFHLLKGDLLHAAAAGAGAAAGEEDPADPEHWYRLAFQRASELGGRMSQLRAATRLGRLRLARGEADAAGKMLEPLYAGFAEGFGTADLREARAVLDAVAAAR